MPTTERVPYEPPAVADRTDIDRPLIGGPLASGPVGASAVFR